MFSADVKEKEENHPCVRAFRFVWGHEPQDVLFCPYRIAPLGAHVDHQMGKVTGMAIDQGSRIAFEARGDALIDLQSLNYQPRMREDLQMCFYQKRGDWTDYVRGAVKVMMKRYGISRGIAGVLEGTLPAGGLSSSASVTICVVRALAEANEIRMDESALISVAMQTENEFVGVRCGKLDPSCEVYSRKDHLLYLDCLTDAHRLISWPEKRLPFGIAVLFSGIRHSLVRSDYNRRREECARAAEQLTQYAGMESKVQAGSVSLRDVPEEVFHAYGERLEASIRKRAQHYYTEIRRVERGIEAWEKGDISSFGALMFESGKSSIDHYECGSEQMIALYRIMTETDGIFGGRFSGAGFRGYCLALTDPEKTEDIAAKVREKYLKCYPGLEDRFLIRFCRSADGVVL